LAGTGDAWHRAAMHHRLEAKHPYWVLDPSLAQESRAQIGPATAAPWGDVKEVPTGTEWACKVKVRAPIACLRFPRANAARGRGH
jgi:hypothetical protein